MLSDNEIIKAYEFCLKDKGCTGCIADKYSKSGEIDCKLKPQDIIDVFNRLQAENKRLQEIILTDRSEAIKKLKAEAYKECIEKIKALFPSDNEPYQYWEIHEGADNLLKEFEVDYDTPNFCPECGQALDWSESDV